jgi:hypothetical protein
MLKHLGHRLTLLLPCLLAMIVCMLEAACAPLTLGVRCSNPDQAQSDSVLQNGTHKRRIFHGQQ